MKNVIFIFVLCVSFLAQAQEADVSAPAAPSAPAAVPSRMPASAVVPQRFFDKEMNVACYYLAPADTNGVMSMYAAINCVKLEDPEDKADRELQRRERQQDRARNASNERAAEDRENYELNQKELQKFRSKTK